MLHTKRELHIRRVRNKLFLLLLVKANWCHWLCEPHQLLFLVRTPSTITRQKTLLQLVKNTLLLIKSRDSCYSSKAHSVRLSRAITYPYFCLIALIVDYGCHSSGDGIYHDGLLWPSFTLKFHWGRIFIFFILVFKPFLGKLNHEWYICSSLRSIRIFSIWILLQLYYILYI